MEIINQKPPNTTLMWKEAFKLFCIHNFLLPELKHQQHFHLADCLKSQETRVVQE